MNYYLGYIELRRTYYNFHPQYIYNDDDKTIEEFSKDAAKEKFPFYGSLNLAYSLNKDSHNFLKSLDVESIDKELNRQPSNTIYAIAINDAELEESDDDKIQIKLDLQKLFNNGYDLENLIFPVEKLGMYKIVTPTHSITDESFSSNILVNEFDYKKGSQVLLEQGHNLFGPYSLLEHSTTGEKYVRPDCGSNKFVVEYFDETSYEFMSFEKTYYLPLDSFYTDFAHTYKKPTQKDVISDAILLTKLKDDINLDLLKTNPEEFERLYSTSPLLGKVSPEIRTHRMERILDILQKTQEFEENKSKALSSLIDSLGNKIFDLLGDKVKDSKIYKDLKTNEQKLQNDNDFLRAQEIDLQEKNNALNAEIENLKEKTSTANEQTIDTETLKVLQDENSDLKAKLSIIDNFEELKKECDVLDDKYRLKQIQYDNKVREVDAKQKELETIQSNLQAFIKNELNKADSTKMLRTAFDPYISNAMIEAASNYRSETENDRYKKISEEMINFPCESLERETLINMLVDGVQKFRNYKRNDIINIYICLSQNFLTIFSGEPGTGKTSICNIIANSLGLNLFGEYDNISRNRFAAISVERGWSTKRDLIGYFNPLTKKYDRSNAKIYDSLMILNEERTSSKFPYLILLDEANLSPMEYYWADFMRAADKNDNDVFVNIGLEQEVFIPKTLHFLATINNDQTTEQLSPRLIDRAWIIKLPKTAFMETTEKIENCFKNIISWEDIEQAFVLSETKEMSLKSLAEQIYKLFEEHHLSVSPRIQQSIKNYVCVAQEIMEDELGVCSKKEKALDFAIVQKLLPKINGYYKDYERLFSSLIQICDENNLRMTKEALINMQDFQKQNMGYCQYLV